MRQIILKPFQEQALENLTDEFLHKWKKESKQTIRFQAPTGSGKTVMMAQFVKELVNDPRLTEANLGFLWVSIGGSKDGDLASQSKKKFIEYYDGNVAIDITGLDDLDRDKVLEQNEILFFNWSKIKTANKDGRKLRRDGETEITWDGMLERTKLEDRNIVLIIDEAHRETGTLLADEEVKLIDPRIILKVTATKRILTTTRNAPINTKPSGALKYEIAK
jgi:type I site-specific restriction-modification system R (restriction) subunit